MCGGEGEPRARGRARSTPGLPQSSQTVVGVPCVFSLGINPSPKRGDVYAPIW